MNRTWLLGLPTLGALDAMLALLPISAAAFADVPAAAPSVPSPPPCATLPSPDNFVSVIDNAYLPWIPGTVFRYVGSKDGEVQKTVVTVTSETKVILGINTTVVHDNVYAQGQLVEQTSDWYAQDKDGNVWYMGEDSKELKNGHVISTEGSWEAGKDGAQAGIIAEAHPRPGDTYSQECAPGVAQDAAQLINLNATITVPAGTYQHVLVTREWTPLEPTVLENKWYGQGVGNVKAQDVRGSNEASQLVSVVHGG
jgi:hypothetical protein